MFSHARSMTGSIRRSRTRSRGIVKVWSGYAARPCCAPNMNSTRRRLSRLENWRSNIIGRAIAIALIGTLFVAVIAGFVTHLLST